MLLAVFSTEEGLSGSFKIVFPQTLHIYKLGLHQKMKISNKQKFFQFG